VHFSSPFSQRWEHASGITSRFSFPQVTPILPGLLFPAEAKWMFVFCLALFFFRFFPIHYCAAMIPGARPAIPCRVPLPRFPAPNFFFFICSFFFVLSLVLPPFLPASDRVWHQCCGVLLFFSVCFPRNFFGFEDGRGAPFDYAVLRRKSAHFFFSPFPFQRSPRAREFFFLPAVCPFECL